MASFFKSFGKGCLYFLLFPLGIVAIALYAVYGIFVFLFELIRLIVLFFSGRKLHEDLPEDIEAKRRITRMNDGSDLSLYPQDSIVYGSGYQTPRHLQQDDEKEENPEPVEPMHEDVEEKEEDKEDEYFDRLV